MCLVHRSNGKPGESRFKGGEDNGQRDPVHTSGAGTPPRRTWRRTMRDLVRMLMAGGELIVTGILAGARIRSRAGSSDSFLLERGIQDEGQIPSGKN